MTPLETIQEANFDQQVLQSPLPVLLDFGAEWCAPCKRLEPILEKLSQEWQGRVRIVRVDADQNPTLAGRYQVMSLPTVILLVKGQEVARQAGLATRERLVEKFSGQF